MGFNFISGAPHDVHAASIGLPAGDSRSEMFVGVRYAPIMLFLEIVVRKIGIATATKPKLFDELLALFIGIKLQESLPLFGRDNVDDVLVEPLLVGRIQFLEGFAKFFPLLFVKLLRGGSCVGIAGVWRGKRGRDDGKRKDRQYRGTRY